MESCFHCLVKECGKEKYKKHDSNGNTISLYKLCNIIVFSLFTNEMRKKSNGIVFSLLFKGMQKENKQ